MWQEQETIPAFGNSQSNGEESHVNVKPNALHLQ